MSFVPVSEELPRYAKGEMSADVTVPWNFKPSSLVGQTVEVTQHGVKRQFSVVRSYTFRKYPWGRKRLRFYAEACD